jgi:hypothetical protein
MTWSNPDASEFEILEYILKLGNAIPEKKLGIKCKHKGIDCEKFLKDWGTLITVKISRSEKLSLLMI